MATGRLTEKDIRMFLLDKPELNPLLRGLKWGSEEIEAAMIMTVSYFNETPPPTGQSYTVETFPFSYAYLIGVSGHLLRSASINDAVNNLNYSLDGVQVNDKDKAEIFARLGQQYWEEYKQMVVNIKTTQNVAAAYGNMNSEFRAIGY